MSAKKFDSGAQKRKKLIEKENREKELLKSIPKLTGFFKPSADHGPSGGSSSTHPPEGAEKAPAAPMDVAGQEQSTARSGGEEPSAEGRKKRKEETEKRAQDKGALLKYFGQTSATPGPSSPPTGPQTDDSSSDVSVAAEDTTQAPQPSTSSNTVPAAQPSPSSNTVPAAQPSTSSNTVPAAQPSTSSSDQPAAAVTNKVPQPSTSSSYMIPAVQLTSSTDSPPATSQYPATAQPLDPSDWPSVLSDVIRHLCLMMMSLMTLRQEKRGGKDFEDFLTDIGWG